MNNYLRLILVWLLLLCSDTIFAQSTGILRGFLSDVNNGEVLAYGNVYIKEIKAGGSTDGNGYYYITGIPAGKSYTVVYSYVGYKSKELKILIPAGKMVQQNVALEPSSYQLETIEKVANAINREKNSTNIGLQRISIKELEKLPKGVETDVFRSLQYIPGVKSTGDVSARYYVRGGASNQNLVLLNGATVYNPFHALGLFSVIDPEMINNVEFFKGGFSSEFGGRVSSVLKVLTKDGNRINYSAKASASLMTGKALVEGPFAGGSFLITGRKSVNSEILKKFLDDQSVPMDFYDFSFKVNTNNPFIENGKFIFYGFLSGDKLKMMTR